jgi:hypothetical protein
MSNIIYTWIAQDRNGEIYKFDNKPTLRNDDYWPEAGNDYIQMVEKGKRNENWKDSLINLETHDFKIVDGILIRVDRQENQQKHSHYKKDVKHLDYIDVYRIIDLYELNDPCFQHALKKILVPGARGHKDLTKDINDIIDAMQRKLEMLAEDDKLC